MHELSIALSIIEGVEQERERLDGAQVRAVHLKLGPLSGVVKDALLFSYEVACAGTALEGSRLEIEEVPITIYCPQCRREQPAMSIQLLCCGVCQTPGAEVRQGRELEVFALELSDERAAAAG